MSRLYLDHNAGRPPLGSARAAARAAALEGWGNPHSAHSEGRAARRILEQARRRVAALAGRDPDHVFFTSGGTEAAHAALIGAARARRETDDRVDSVVISVLEHVALAAAADALRRDGFRVRTVPCRPDGTVDPVEFVASCGENTAVAALIAGQNEIGTLQPVGEVVGLLARRAVPVVVDAVQLPGLSQPVLPEGGHVLGVLSSHKMGGLAGAGAVIANPDIGLTPFLGGGEQERRRRAGTPALALIAAMGAAADEMAARDTELVARRVGDRRDDLEQRVVELLDNVIVIGQGAPRLPTTSALCIEGALGEDVVAGLDLRGVSVSTGAACSVGSGRPSSALIALGFPRDQARGLVRISLGGSESAADMEHVATALADVVTAIRRHVSPAGRPA